MICAALCLSACSSSRGAGSTPPPGSWTPVTQLAQNSAGIESISCPTTTWCIAVDGAGYPFTYASGQWTSGPRLFHNATPGGFRPSVSCASQAFCMAGAESSPYQYDNGQWSAAPTSTPFQLKNVSCTSAVFCAATGSDGSTHTFNGSTWSTTNIYLGETPGSEVASISCTGPTFCVSVDGAGVSHVLNFIDDLDVASNLDSASSPALESVSCTSGDVCVAVSQDGRVFTYSGGKWSTGTQLIGNTYPINAISCSSPTFCLVAGSGDTAWAYTDGRWSRDFLASNVYISAGVHSISCNDSRRCMVGYEDNDFVSMFTSDAMPMATAPGNSTSPPLQSRPPPGPVPSSASSAPPADPCIQVDADLLKTSCGYLVSFTGHMADYGNCVGSPGPGGCGPTGVVLGGADFGSAWWTSGYDQSDSIQFNLSKKFAQVDGSAGIPNVTDPACQEQLTVLADGHSIFSAILEYGSPQALDLQVTGVSSLVADFSTVSGSTGGSCQGGIGNIVGQPS